MTTFDPDLFLNTQVSSEFSTQAVPIPDGEYAATIDTVTGRQAKDSTIMDILWQIIPVGNEAADNRKVRQSVFLELNDGGALDGGKGKNVQLGRLLEGLGINGQPWSPATLRGKVAKIKVTSRMGEGEHAGKTFHDVKGVTKQ